MILANAKHSMRAGLVASAIFHVAVVLWAFVFWERARPFVVPPPEYVTVDLVTSKELAAAEPEETQSKSSLKSAPPASSPTAAPAPAPSKLPAWAPIEAQIVEAAREALRKPDSEDDAPPSETPADLAAKKLAAFKERLSRCWTPLPPARDTQKLKVVIRIGLRMNGELAGEPALLQAPASASGPVLVKNAMRALQQCQPYNFLPAESYKEWKTLDLSFSPEGLSGV
jgi:hypothetical protein